MATLLIVLGLFFAGGVWSFWKQKLPKGVVLVLAFAAAMCLAAGIMRL
ncbi:hypothetical protein K353_01950 [Kitasatospora sp. SolWspMP-SS2h]|nr:hypothetical protein [Kitasatospora sp. SolWspMP-SS2h]RAJ43691.1 hypothetical protein K353_01950 [Kitasatospora sp. SolWspMP-SS2h]